MPLPPTRRAVMLAVASLSMAGFHAGASAQWKPERPVTLVVPYSPGGGTDAQARAVAHELQQLWGQPVIVDNVPGADGAIGTRKVLDAKPDGYTLLLQIPSLTLLKDMPAFKGLDPVSQLAPISAISFVPAVFVANSKAPGNTMREMLLNCKTAAKPCSFGTTENFARLQSKVLSAEAGIDNLIVVNYKGGGQLINDLVANNVNMAIMGITAALPHHRSGALKILATLGGKRTAVVPGVPSTTEAGFRSLDFVTWYGLFAPRETSPSTVLAIANAVKESIKGEATLKSFASLGAEPIGSTPPEFALMVRHEAQRIDAISKRYPLEQETNRP